MKKTFLFASIGAVIIFTLCACPPHIDVWDNNKITASYPIATLIEPTDEASPKAEIYIDASGSMKPYFVERVAENLINTISDIGNLNVANTTLYFQDYPQSYPYEDRDRVYTIITNVKNQPNKTASIFYKFFREQANKIDTTNVLTYLVTDAIMSEGDGQGGSKNTILALGQLKGLVTSALEGHSNLATAILRYEGGYEGDYWNQSNQRVTVKQCPLLGRAITRPYYVIVLGKKETVRWLQTLPNDKLNNPEGRLFMGIHDFAGHNHATLSKDTIVPIEFAGEPITLVLDLPSCLKDLDASQVKVISSEKELSVQVEKDVSATGIISLSAMIPPTTPIIPDKDGICTISFIIDNAIPSVWLNEWNCDDDSAGPDTVSTFSLSTLVRGMFEALEGDSPLLRCDFKYRLPD